MGAPERRRLSLAAYEALEAASPERFEFRRGEAVALAAPSGNHGRIVGNLVLALGPRVRAAGCDFFSGDAKVITPAGDRLIPDFVVTCDASDRASLDGDSEARLRAPRLVIEVISSSSVTDDLADKVDAYASIRSVTHYVAIDSRRRAVRLHARATDGTFAVAPIFDTLALGEVGCLTVMEIYRDTTIAADGPEPVAPSRTHVDDEV